MNRTTASLALLLAGMIPLAAIPARAQAPAAGPIPPALVPTISTHASAERRLPNDVADMQVSIEIRDRTAQAVQAAIGPRSQTLLGYLKQQSVDRLQTGTVDLQPEVQSEKGKPDQVVGFSGRITVSFAVPPDRVPDILAGVLANGGTGIDRVAFAPRPAAVDEGRNAAAAEAAQRAVALAESVAKALGRQSAGVLRVAIDPGSVGFRGPMPAPMLAAARAAVPIAIAPGDTTVTATADVTITLTR